MRIRSITIAGGFLAVVLLWLGFTTYSIATRGGFRWQHVRSERSPDGTLEMTVAKRVQFPAFEWVDPAIVMRVEVLDSSTKRNLALDNADLMEDSDFRLPIVSWRDNQVTVSGFDRRYGERALTLSYDKR